MLSLDPISLLGTIFSVASFIVSLVVLLSVRKLRMMYKLRVRGPSLIKDLSNSAANLSKYLSEYEDSIPQIQEELGRIAVKLKALEDKISGRVKASVTQLHDYVDQCEANAENEIDVRRVYLSVTKVTEELKDYQKDIDWEL